MNVFNFTARLGKDADTRYIASGDAVTSFTAAVSSGFGEKAVTTWVTCSMWGKRGEAVQPYLLKGTQVAISGELTNREYTDKEGAKRYSLEVRVNDLTLLGGKKEEGSASAPRQEESPRQGRAAPPVPSGGVDEMADDIPF